MHSLDGKTPGAGFGGTEQVGGSITRLGELGEAEVLFVRSLRGWALGVPCWRQVWNEHARRFGGAEGRIVLRAFVAFFDGIRGGARRQILHHPPCCPHLAPDEAEILGVLLATVLEHADAARFRALTLVEADRVEAVLEAGRSLALAYERRGLKLLGGPPLEHEGPMTHH